MASTALTARAASVPSAMRVSMLVAPRRSNRTVVRRNGHPPANSTATARMRTAHPSTTLPSVGAARAITNAASARGHEMAARRAQWSDRSRATAPSSSSTAVAE